MADYDDIVALIDADGGPVVQTEALFRAANIKHFERAGFGQVLTFQLVKEQTTNKLAADFFLQAAQTWNGVADVILTHQDHAGAETDYTIAGAKVTVKAQPPIGVTNVATVTVMGKEVA